MTRLSILDPAQWPGGVPGAQPVTLTSKDGGWVWRGTIHLPWQPCPDFGLAAAVAGEAAGPTASRTQVPTSAGTFGIETFLETSPLPSGLTRSELQVKITVIRGLQQADPRGPLWPARRAPGLTASWWMRRWQDRIIDRAGRQIHEEIAAAARHALLVFLAAAQAGLAYGSPGNRVLPSQLRDQLAPAVELMSSLLGAGADFDDVVAAGVLCRLGG